ncbi:Hypothetical predicted protein [Mytilus galloprovincialis]|uniref:Mutator-like transposase domain-containing protein n=1 Tax=Mytilus galloprovincialis TaxID=29158 RepID=A0A8B6D6Z5_MYTGA|nr:Hypothetical predicted protein [Mytilus galloprovincialis]
MFNLYNEVIAKKRGRRTAAINLSIQVALNHIAISTTGLQKLFLGSNIPAPSTSSMQHSANVVSEIIEEYNQKDLVQKRKLIKEINILRGDNPNIINIQADGMYNNPIYSGMGKTPFQPATQCTYNMLENNTYKHSIVSTRQVSKLCSNKSEHKTKTKVKSHKGHCSANIEMHDSIGSEERWAKDCLLDLKNDGLEVQEITTDPDSSAFRAAESLFKAENTAALLRECVKYRLGPTMLNRTCKNTNTQKAEATNRAIRATVPSNVTFTRNYKGRVHTAIHNVNNGPGESIVKLCKAAGVPIEPGSRAAEV